MVKDVMRKERLHLMKIQFLLVSSSGRYHNTEYFKVALLVKPTYSDIRENVEKAILSDEWLTIPQILTLWRIIQQRAMDLIPIPICTWPLGVDAWRIFFETLNEFPIRESKKYITNNQRLKFYSILYLKKIYTENNYWKKYSEIFYFNLKAN